MAEQINPKEPEKYKHPDEDEWKKANPGKEFKPFDPSREIKDRKEQNHRGDSD